VGLASLILVLALIAGRLAGGRVTELGEIRLRAGALLVVVLVAQVIGSLIAPVQPPMYALGLVASAAAAALFAYRNRHLAGVPLAAIGLLLNALVVVLNGAMPVSAHAAARAGVAVEQVAPPDDPRHEVIGPRTRLRFLSAVIPVPIPGQREVDSPGDVLIAAGIGLLVISGMRSGARLGSTGYFHEPDRDEAPVL
jgi:Family of unknown function (DUF5317)